MISQAFAQGSSMFGDLQSLSSFVPLVLIFVVFYFFLIRPQQKKAQQHREMIGALRRGDRVVTNGGLIGTVVKVLDERELEIEISKGVQVRVIRGMIADVTAKTQPVNSDGVASNLDEAKAKEKKVVKPVSASKAPRKKAPSTPAKAASKPASTKK